MELKLASSMQVQMVFDLIAERIAWMDEKGISHWNVTTYLDVFPFTYFVEKQQAGKMYVLMEQDQLQAACILETDDDGWYDQRPAFYVHQLVSDPGCPGAGSRLLTEVEALAQREGRCLVRLDCMQTNQALNAFYEKRGYRKVGTCQVGLYEGFQREKRV